MARPRVFVSSTFYDLRHVRGELERFITTMGYEAVLNERGNITYESRDALEAYCYREIEKVSMLVSIVGGRFGTQSREGPNNSISHMELKTAVAQGKQAYVFVDKGVLSEYRTYLKNKEKDVSYHHVDDVRIYQFLEEIYSLPFNNQIFGFDDMPEVIGYLKEQWAGLFENYLQQQNQEKLNQLSDTIKSTADTLKELVELLRNDRSGLFTAVQGREEALDAIIIQNHPIFNRIKALTGAPYRVFFTDRTEMEAWLNARQWVRLEREHWDSKDDAEYALMQKNGDQKLLYVSESLFDSDGRLRIMLPNDWKPNLVRTRMIKVDQPSAPSSHSNSSLDDDIPF
ncbi:DUF4062 domain-containing protein [Roseomonas frigidaquae]|uniref:DUF4062 domain-containing protein n=1 Tax=Falsiroseomonas frigidaquae TaxID=487318 RepID=A0ABX1F5K5_9PROT|nr:DUF4062 domain-containing protein [Falsiroseomonas frigidaquae]NKE47622.1 DUF4062 domain-containing protein [Falsiroseomonas frigidaquae]